jgi:hypothetical protein
MKQGWKAAAIFPLPMVMMVFIALFLVNACYLLIMRFSGPGRFRSILDSFQVAFSIIVIASYYLLQGVMKSAAVKDFDPAGYGWVRLTPPYWLASCWSWLGYEAGFAGVKWLGVLALVFPLVSLWVTVRWLAPTFGRKLAELDGVEVSETTQRVSITGKSSVYRNLSNLLNRNDAAKAGFIITWLQTSRSRTFKMRVYPMLAYVPIYFVWLLLMDDKPLSEVVADLPNGNAHLVLLYMSAFAMLQALNYVNMSDQYKAAWVYYSSPVEKPGNVLAGAFKALWLKYLFPFIGLIGIFVISVWGADAIWDVLLAMANVTMYTVCIMRITHRTFPFSVADQVKSGGFKGFMRTLSTMMLMLFLGLSHYIAMLFLWLKILFLVLTLIFLWLVWDSVKNTDWASITKAE